MYSLLHTEAVIPPETGQEPALGRLLITAGANRVSRGWTGHTSDSSWLRVRPLMWLALARLGTGRDVFERPSRRKSRWLPRQL